MSKIILDSNKINIIAAESLGVRGLCCSVKTANRNILIDPGIALGYKRNGLLPHPVQIAIDEIIQKRIITKLQNAADIIFTHFHGDHIPLVNANPYQLSLNKVDTFFKDVNIWAKGNKNDSDNIKARALNIKNISPNYIIAEGKNINGLSFSTPVPHGKESSSLGNVMMVKIEVENKVFVHASDIQFLSLKTIKKIIELQPDIVLASGPPIYLPHLEQKDKEKAWNNILTLSNNVSLLVIDHHLLRCKEGLKWLRNLDNISNNKIACAADVMGYPPQLLEARRPELYKILPVKKDWHEKYVIGKVNTDNYLIQARSILNDFIY